MSDSPPTAYVNARLIDPASGLDGPGGLLTKGATIADLGPGLFSGGVPDGIQTIDCGGHCLSPGLIDMRADLPNLTHEFSDGLSAMAGGVTTLVCLPNLTPVVDSAAMVEYVTRRARQIGPVNVLPYGAITQGLEGSRIAEMGLLSEAGAVAFTDGSRSIINSTVMRRALAYAHHFGRLIVHHAEDPDLAANGAMNEGEIATRLGLTGIPGIAETIMIERDLRLVEITGARYHVSHISTAASIEVMRQAKARGLPVSCDTAPPYFALNESEIGDYRTFAKLSPPLRCEEDRSAVVDGLADGTIDVIVSDHTPRHPDSKRLPFALAAAGIVGLETLLPLGLELYHKGALSLPALLGAMTQRPAELLGLDSGRLAKGATADLILFDSDRPWVVRTDDFLSKAKNSPFDGRPVQGKVIRTVIKGETVFTHPPA